MALRADSVYLSWQNRRRLRWLARAGYGDNADAVAEMIIWQWISEKFPHLAELEAQLEAMENEIPLTLEPEKE